MYKKLSVYFLFAFYLLASNCSVAQKAQDPTVLVKTDTTEITLLFAGDVMGHMPQISSAFDSSTGTYDFNPVFSAVKPLISQADLAVANLETTLAGPPYSGYPQFSAPDALASALKNAGFDLLITANNHCLDRGSKGLERTVKVLDSLQVLSTGTFINDSARAARYPLITDVKGIRLAILNYTYGTNGIPVTAPNVVNFIDTALIKKDLARAKQDSVDYTIVTIHWGTEYERQQNAGQRKIADFLLRNGADMIIGSHPHVVQPMVKYYHTPDSTDDHIVVYSLGNYVSNQRDRYKDGGIMFNVRLQKAGKTRVKDYSYTPAWVFKGMIDNRLQYRILPLSGNSTAIDSLGTDDKARALEFLSDTKELLKDVPVK